MSPLKPLALLLAPVAALELPTFLASDMILPRAPLRPRIWGSASPGNKVVVQLLGQDSKPWEEKTTIADSSGSWLVELEAREVARGLSLRISDKDSETDLRNLAFGDLWLCSGQSNMQFSVNDAFGAGEYIAKSKNPDIRLATVSMVVAGTPQPNVTSKAPYVWSESKPEAFGTKGFSWPSAACYFFGVNLYEQLGRKVPIGLVDSSWGGQRVEAFSSPDALADKTCGATAGQVAVSMGEASDITTWYEPVPNPGPSQLWNAMIHPLLNFRFTGSTWYQGEANAGNPVSYACRFPAMIADWRKKFDLPKMSFLFVQLAALEHANFAAIRDAQMAALKLPLVGYATAIDLGDPTSPAGAIHPRRKFEVGRRLAAAAAHMQYGLKDTGVGPVWGAMVRTEDHGLHVTFSNAEGLHSHPTAACNETKSKLCCAESPFEVQVAGTWKRVPAWTLDGPTSVLLGGDQGRGEPSLDLSNATSLRFLWEGYPQCTLYNGRGGADDHTGISAIPFQVKLPASYEEFIV